MATFLFEGKSIYYEVHGTGEPLVMLNGIMMSCPSWAEFIEPLSANRQLILFDFLDQGRSARMEEDYAQELQAEVVRALLDYLALEQVDLVGISYGGMVAQHFALKYQHRIRRLVLFNTTASTGHKVDDVFLSWNQAADDPSDYYLTTIPIVYSTDFYNENYKWMEFVRSRLLPVFEDESFMGGMKRLARSICYVDLIDRIGTITVPTLVVSSGDDALLPPAEQEKIARRLPNSEYVVMPNCGHASMNEHPLLFTALILGFISTTKTKFRIVSSK